MAFCKYCGKQIADGEQCSCRANQPAPPKAPIIPDLPEADDQPMEAPNQEQKQTEKPTTVLSEEPKTPPQRPADSPYAAKPQASPSNNPYGAPIDNPYGAPVSNPYGAPIDNPYAASAENPYAAPAENPYAPNNMENPYAQPNQQAYNQYGAQPPQTNGYGYPNGAYGAPEPPRQHNGFNNVVSKIDSTDFVGSLKFFVDYIKNPNKACEAAADSKNWVAMLICAVCFVFANAFAQLGLVIKLHTSGGFMFMFGLLYGIFGLVVPPALNIVVATITKTKTSRRNLFFENILHTPIVSILLFFSFLLGIISIGASIAMLFITTIVYVISVSDLITRCLPKKNSMVDKLIRFGIAACFIIAFAILIAIQSACFEEIVESVIYKMLGIGLYY